jgi:hypothetical protein
MRLASDPAILDFVSGLIGQQVDPAVGAAVGEAVVTFVTNAFGDPGSTVVRAAFDSLLASLPGLPSGWDTLRLVWNLVGIRSHSHPLIQTELRLKRQPTFR